MRFRINHFMLKKKKKEKKKKNHKKQLSDKDLMSRKQKGQVCKYHIFCNF